MSTETPTDAEIVARARERPEDFAVLYERRARAVFSYIASRLDASTAEDITSETFLVAFERLDRYDTARDNTLPWLLGIATRLMRRYRRDEVATWRALAAAGGLREHTGSWQGDTDPMRELDGRIDAAASARGIASAVARLPQRDRDVLALTAWTDLDSAGIAEALGIPEGTVRSRLHRARRILRTQLEAGTAREPERSHG